jgi:hypothetical protein
MNAFKPQGIEYICGKNRNIYFKMNKNNTALGKTRYIKYKREFIKLSTFIKEHYNKKTKKHINYDKKPNVTIINNINDIKDKKIRALFKRTFKKNAKIYIYTSKKIKRGGAAFDVDVLRNDDDVVHRKILSQKHDLRLEPTGHDTYRNNSPYPYQLEVEYDAEVDDIILKIFELARVPNIFTKINNIQYSINVDGITYAIRPYIEFVKPYKKFVLFFYIEIGGGSGSTDKWIKLPLHVSLFMNDMIEKIRVGNKDKIERLNTGHIHITSDDKIGNFNIGTTLDNSKGNGQTSNRGRSSAGVSSTHTYLIASNLQKVALIMREHGVKIFKDWYYDTNTENNTRNIHFTLFKPDNKRWEEIQDGSPKFIELSDMQKKSTYKCFDKLHYIIGNIFHIMNNGRIDNEYLETATSLISSTIIRPSDYGYLPYKPSQTQKPNIRYTKNSRDERKSLIDLDDLKKGKIISGRSVVRSRSADPRGRVEVPLDRPSVRVRSVDAPTYRHPVRREGDPRDGRGHSAEPPRGRTGRDGRDERDGRHPVARTGYRRGGMPMSASMHPPTHTPMPTLMPTSMPTPMPTPMPMRTRINTNEHKRHEPYKRAPQAINLKKEEIEAARKNAYGNLKNVDAERNKHRMKEHKQTNLSPHIFLTQEEINNEKQRIQENDKKKRDSAIALLRPTNTFTDATIREAQAQAVQRKITEAARIAALTPAEKQALKDAYHRQMKEQGEILESQAKIASAKRLFGNNTY